jgi:hypothetical protein
MGDNQAKVDVLNNVSVKPSFLSSFTSKIKFNNVRSCKLTYFLGGFGISFGYLYFHFISYISNVDESLKNDIVEIKKLIEQHNTTNNLTNQIKMDINDKINQKL